MKEYAKGITLTCDECNYPLGTYEELQPKVKRFEDIHCKACYKDMSYLFYPHEVYSVEL
jgi:hypothetical protein